MRKLHSAVCLLLIALMLIQPVTAADVFTGNGARNASVDSVLKVKPRVTEQEAAERLYYLGLLSGVGTVDGAIDFALERRLTNLECIIMVIRLIGAESEVLQNTYPHPFTDVPDWGSAYVGYFVHLGIVSNTDTLFSPNETVSTAVFVKYMLSALGYATDGSDYALMDALSIGRKIGICAEAERTVTRGQAALMMYRTLDTTCKNSTQTLSFRLVQDGLLNYRDVQFLLWNENRAEITAYIKAQGYTTIKSLRDGKYTITLSGEKRCLNIFVNGANQDYEGVKVTTWTRTDDISQKFRVEQTKDGTYRIYSCASKGGYNRLLGFNYLQNAALFSPYSPYAGEFILRYDSAKTGAWYLLWAKDPSLALSNEAGKDGTAITLAPIGEEGFEQLWSFEFDEVINEEGYEFAIYPAEDMLITQGYYDTYSHQKQNAIDITTRCGAVFAPFTGEIVRVDRGYSRFNTVWLQSQEPVVYADGTVDYMTVVFMHDNNVNDLYIGQIVVQGEYFYHAGVAGGATGPHVHIAVIRGKYQPSMALTGSGDVHPEQALFVRTQMTLYSTYGLDWVYLN